MSFHNFLSIGIIGLGGLVSFRILTYPLNGRELELAVMSCVGLIAIASWLLKHS